MKDIVILLCAPKRGLLLHAKTGRRDDGAGLVRDGGPDRHSRRGDRRGDDRVRVRRSKPVMRGKRHDAGDQRADDAADLIAVR